MTSEFQVGDRVHRRWGKIKDKQGTVQAVCGNSASVKWDGKSGIARIVTRYIQKVEETSK